MFLQTTRPATHARRMLRTVLLLALTFLPCASAGEGFVPLFDGKTPDGWDGDPVYRSVKDGAVVGEVTPETLLERNPFLIGR